MNAISNYLAGEKSTDRATLDLWPDTGRLLGLSRGATYAAAHRGEIPTIRLGKRILVPRAALDRLLASGGGAAA